jgi:hypothetical protein
MGAGVIPMVKSQVFYRPLFTGTRRTLKPGSLSIMEDAMGYDGPGGTR